jgi:hypothetical protein
VQQFLHQIEAKLLSSETYQQALTTLQSRLGEIAEDFQSLLTNLGREAIQLTLHQLATEKQTEADSTSANAEFVTVTDAPASEAVQDFAQKSATPQTAKSAVAKEDLSDRDLSILQLGQQIKQLRQTKGITLNQLYNQTYVPLHHLKALEAGQLDRLPEDIFLRGFVRRLGGALGVDGAALAAQIPQPAQPKRIVPSWQKRHFKPMIQLSPVHLYVGYATLMAGAVGGLTWATQPPQPQSAQPQNSAVPEAEMRSQTNTRIQANQSKQQAANLAQMNVSPPETLPNR